MECRPVEGEADDGTPGVSLAMNDLVYVTLPGGEEHVFAFRPIPMVDTSQNGAGFVLGVVTYVPNFVPVDGSTTALQPCDGNGNPVLDAPLLWDSYSGNMFKSEDNGYGYNPALDDFGGYYVMTTVDGTRYVVNAATGQLHSQTDLLGRTQTWVRAE